MNQHKDRNPETFTRKYKFWKFWFVMIVINIGFLAVIIRLIDIQIVNGAKYNKIARRQHESQVPLIAKRGDIYDRYGRLLASTIESVSIAVDPRMIKKTSEFAKLLEEDLNIPKESTLKKIKSEETAFLWIVRKAEPYKVENIKKLNDRGIIFIKEPRRIYHYGGIGAQIVGLTDVDNNGLSGMELALDTVLKGAPGFMVMSRDALGRLHPAADLPTFPPKDGLSVQLTLDIELQRIVEHELKEGVESAQAESGTVVALDPYTGEVMAMASYPGFDPHNIRVFAPQAMRIRSITDVYEPGSTFKLITAAAALEENVVKESDMFDGHNGVLKLNSYTIKDVHPLGRVNFVEALEHSSNIIMSTVASMIPEKKFYKYVRDFGFGLKLGIDIPGEVSGRIPGPSGFNSTVARYMGFGYGLNCTALQVACAYSAVANGGKLMKPYVVKKTFGNAEIPAHENYPETIRRVISDSTSARLKKLLRGVVENGTGKTALIPGLGISGKTGTSQQITDGHYSKQNYNASFAGFFPTDSPRVAMIVVLDKPRTSIYGGSTSGPIFKKIAMRWIAVHNNIMLAQNYAANDSSFIYQDSVLMPDVTGMDREDAQEILKRTGLKPVVTGTEGIIIGQTPPLFSHIARGSEVRLKSGKSDSTPADNKKGIPPIEGMPLRRALTILQNSGYDVKAIGSGIVKRYERTIKDGKTTVTVYCY